MVGGLVKLIESGLKNNKKFSEIENDLIAQGYPEQDINDAAKKLSSNLGEERVDHKTFRSLNRKLLLDRISYGFGSNQFINIIFTFTGANLFLIGVINGLKSFFATILSGFVIEYLKKNTLQRSFIRVSGLLFGFSFILLSFAATMRYSWLFVFGLLLGSIGVVIYGESFRNMMITKLGKMNFSALMARFTSIGLVITTFSIIFSAFIMDALPREGLIWVVNLTGKYNISYKVQGYIISFIITAIASILSAHVMSKITLERKNEDRPNLLDFLEFYFKETIGKIKYYMTNKYLVLIGIATLAVAIFQSIINSYVGIYIFYEYQDAWFGGFLNIAIVFSAALIASMLGPLVASRLNKYLGLAPMFVFGAIIMTVLPFTLIYNPTGYYPAIVAAASLSVVGVGIIGSGQSILISRLLNSKDRQTYYESNGVLMMIPFVITVTLLSLFIFKSGILNGFKYLSIGLLIVLIPVYMVLVIWSERKKI